MRRSGVHTNTPNKIVHWGQWETTQAAATMPGSDEWLDATLDYQLDPVTGSNAQHRHEVRSISLHVDGLRICGEAALLSRN